jgi:hypothetical protein
LGTRSDFVALDCDDRVRRRILTLMLSRVSALVLAAIVGGTPVSATACEIVCALRADAEASSDAAASWHACHDTESTGAVAVMSGQGHVCGHDADLPVSFRATADRSVPYPDRALVLAPPIVGVALPSLAWRAAKFPPGHSRPPVPLRI